MEKYEYTADDLTLDEAFQEADIVLTGKIVKLDVGEPEGMGQIYFSNTEVTIDQIEKGSLTGPTCVLGYQAVSFRDMKIVPVPKPGNNYRFYVSVREGGKILKAFKVTDV